MRTDAHEASRWFRWVIIALLAFTSGCSIPGPYTLLRKVVRFVPPEEEYELPATPQAALKTSTPMSQTSRPATSDHLSTALRP